MTTDISEAQQGRNGETPNNPSTSRKTSLKDILIYSTGEGANSLVMNTFFTFAMLYYTKAMGMSGKEAGFAMALVMLWDAISDPLMGHITDNTRSRFGRRHPYMLIGGVLTVLCFYFVWAVPPCFQTPERLFWYLVAMNLLLRTGSTIFGVPYIALGFEVCTNYNQRTTLQGVRTGLNMAVNLLGPAILVWNVFLHDRGGPVGSGSADPENYKMMGLTFSVVALLFILTMLFGTRKYAKDSRSLAEAKGGNRLGDIFNNLYSVLFDPYPRTVFLFITILFIGVVLLTSMQIFVYLDFMRFNEWQKTIVHGGTMVAAGFGSLLAGTMVRLFDKKSAIYVLLSFACFGNIVLVCLFGTEWVPTDLTWNAIPLAMLLFMGFHLTYHLGSTAATTIATSMMADVSEINRYRTGILKDGSYSAMLSFVLKAAISVGLILNGFCLDLIGFSPALQQQPPEVARRMLFAAFLGGSIITALAMFMISRYPVTRAYMEEIQAELAAGRGMRICTKCGYNLHGNVSGICPECGTPVEPEQTPALND